MKEIFHRVSVRKFTEQEVEEEKITRILKAAMSSPSAKNQREWEFYVVRNKEKLIELSQATPYSMCVKNAPLAIIICYKTMLLEPDFKEIDCAIAAENILLEVDHLDLGAVMIGVSPNEERMKTVEQILQIPNTLRAFTIIPIGYPLREKIQSDRFEEEKVHYID